MNRTMNRIKSHLSTGPFDVLVPFVPWRDMSTDFVLETLPKECMPWTYLTKIVTTQVLPTAQHISTVVVMLAVE